MRASGGKEETSVPMSPLRQAWLGDPAKVGYTAQLLGKLGWGNPPGWVTLTGPFRQRVAPPSRQSLHRTGALQKNAFKSQYDFRGVPKIAGVLLVLADVGNPSWSRISL